MLQEIKSLQAKVPFEPFVIRLSSGRKLLVANSETVRVRPNHHVLLFFNEKLDAAEDFEASTITRIEKAPRKPRKLRNRAKSSAQ